MDLEEQKQYGPQTAGGRRSGDFFFFFFFCRSTAHLSPKVGSMAGRIHNPTNRHIHLSTFKVDLFAVGETCFSSVWAEVTMKACLRCPSDRTFRDKIVTCCFSLNSAR